LTGSVQSEVTHPFFLQGVEQGVDAALLQREGALRPPFDLLRDRVAVGGTVAQHREHEQLGVAANEVGVLIASSRTAYLAS